MRKGMKSSQNKKFTHLAVFFICAFLLLIPTRVSGAVTAPEYTFTTLNDTTISTNGTGHKATVLIFGQTICSNTSYTLSEVAKSDWVKSPDIQVIFAEINKASKESVQAFVDSYGSADIVSCYDTGSSITSALWNYVITYYGSASTVSLPVTVLIDGNNMIQDVHCDGAQSADELITKINKFADTGYTTTDPYYGLNVNLAISGTEDYVSANTVYQLVNQARNENGLSNLYLDKELTETAMQRAAELAIYYSHLRPDGSSCFSVFPNQNVGKAENIALGYGDAESVMTGWLNSSGHYANIMNTDVTNIGVGCFVDDMGMCYWVQCFDSDSEYTETVIQNRPVTRTILTKASFVNLYTEEKNIYKCNNTTTKTQMIIGNVNTQFNYSIPTLEASLFEFSSDNPSVATVDALGNISIKATGTATITATLKGTIPISVSKIIEKREHNTVTTATKSYCSSCGTVYWENPDTGEFNDEDISCTHTYKSYVTPASFGKNGTAERKCTKCGYARSKENISAIQTVALATEKYTYNGKSRTPDVQVFDKQGYELMNGIDYEVSYNDSSKDIGIYKVKVQLKGNYTGAKTLKFSIVPKKVTLSKIKTKKKQMTVSWKKDSRVTGYEIQYSLKSNFSSPRKVVVNKNTASQINIKKLKSEKCYYIRIRSYKKVKVDGKTQKLYSAWSSKKRSGKIK